MVGSLRLCRLFIRWRFSLSLVLFLTVALVSDSTEFVSATVPTTAGHSVPTPNTNTNTRTQTYTRIPYDNAAFTAAWNGLREDHKLNKPQQLTTVFKLARRNNTKNEEIKHVHRLGQCPLYEWRMVPKKSGKQSTAVLNDGRDRRFSLILRDMTMERLAPDRDTIFPCMFATLTADGTREDWSCTIPPTDAGVYKLFAQLEDGSGGVQFSAPKVITVLPAPPPPEVAVPKNPDQCNPIPSSEPRKEPPSWYYIRSFSNMCLFSRTLSKGRELGWSERVCWTWWDVKNLAAKKGMLIQSMYGSYLSANVDGSFSLVPNVTTSAQLFHMRGSVLLTSFNTFVQLTSTLLRHGPMLPDEPSLLTRIKFIPAVNMTEYREIIEKSPKVAPKIVWAMWHSGIPNLPKLHAINLKLWYHVLGPEWKINVVNLIPGDPMNVYNFLPAKYLPSTFQHLWVQHQSDIIRLGLLQEHGGLWLDLTLILVKHPAHVFSRSPPHLTAFHNESPEFSRKHLAYLQFTENWFLWSPPRNWLVTKWLEMLLQFTEDGFPGFPDVTKHPMLVHTDTTNFHRGAMKHDYYQVAYVLFGKLVEENPMGRMMFFFHMDGASGIKPWSVNSMSHVNERNQTVSGPLHHMQTYDPAKAAEILTYPLLKFGGKKCLDVNHYNDIVNSKSTLGLIYQAAFKPRNYTCT